MRHRWLSGRALLLHLSLVVWFPGCLIAFWWQVHRAFSGNGLSYVYSVEWPVFAVTGVWAWWQLVHTDPGSVGRRAQERMAAALAVGDGREGEDRTRLHAVPGSATAARAGLAPSGGPARAGAGLAVRAMPASGATAGETGGPRLHAVRRHDEEDPELAAYNDRLARLADGGPKTWRRR